MLISTGKSATRQELLDAIHYLTNTQDTIRAIITGRGDNTTKVLKVKDILSREKKS